MQVAKQNTEQQIQGLLDMLAADRSTRRVLESTVLCPMSRSVAAAYEPAPIPARDRGAIPVASNQPLDMQLSNWLTATSGPACARYLDPSTFFASGEGASLEGMYAPAGSEPSGRWTTTFSLLPVHVPIGRVGQKQIRPGRPAPCEDPSMRWATIGDALGQRRPADSRAAASRKRRNEPIWGIEKEQTSVMHSNLWFST